MEHFDSPRYRIYYADGSTYDGDPENAPGTGVIVIVQDDDDCGRSMLHGEPVYCWHDWQGWFQHDTVGWHLCASEPGWRKVVFGQHVDTPTYRAIYERALRDPDFRPKQFPAPPEKRAP